MDASSGKDRVQVMLLVSTRSRLFARVFEEPCKSGWIDCVRLFSKVGVKIDAH